MFYFLETILFFLILTDLSNYIKTNIFIESQLISYGDLNIDIDNSKYFNKNSKPSEFVLRHKKIYEDSIVKSENDKNVKYSLMKVKEQHFNKRITNDENTNILNDQSGNSFFSRINLYNKKKEKLELGQDYCLIYRSDSKMVSNFEYQKFNALNIFDEKYYPIKCYNTYNKFNFEQNVYELDENLKIKKSDFFSFTNLILDHDGILYLSTIHNKNKNPILKKIEEEFEEEFNKGEIKLSEVGIKNFWISIKKEKESRKLNGNLILLLRDEVTLVIFKLKSDEKKTFHLILKFDTKLNFNSKIPGGVDSSNKYNITKAQVIENGNTLIIGTYENGLNIFKRNQTSSSSDNIIEFEYLISITNFFNKERNIVRILLIDFIVSDKIIYLLIDKFGIKQYSLGTFKLSNYEFYHPFIKNLVRHYRYNNNNTDLYNGRNYQTASISDSDSAIFSFGATVDNKSLNVTEFYIEFVVEKAMGNNYDKSHNPDNENNNLIHTNSNEEEDVNANQSKDRSKINTIPVINKVYYSNRHLDFKNFYNDGDHSYFYDNKSKNLLLIPNSYNKIFPSILFKFDFSKIFPDNSSDILKNKLSKFTFFDIPGMIFIKTISKSNFDTTINSLPSNNFLFISKFFSSGSTLSCSFKNFGNFVFNVTSFENSISPSEFENVIVLDKKTIFLKVFNDKVYIWAIFGIVIGCLLILLILFFVLTRRRKPRSESHIVQINTITNSNNDNGRDGEDVYDNVEMERKISENQNMNDEKEIVIGFDEKFKIHEKYQI